jgi:hypothetical protein
MVTKMMGEVFYTRRVDETIVTRTTFVGELGTS